MAIVLYISVNLTSEESDEQQQFLQVPVPVFHSHSHSHFPSIPVARPDVCCLLTPYIFVLTTHTHLPRNFIKLFIP